MRSKFVDSKSLRWDHSTQQFETIPYKDLAWPVDDAGALYGAILVERFRSYGQNLLDLTNHRVRFLAGADAFGIRWTKMPFDFQSSAEHLLALNRELLEHHGDLSFVLLLSPGKPSSDGKYGDSASLMMHVGSLPFAKLNRWYTHGVHLAIGSQQVVPRECWSNQIKSRSRLPYYLSDTNLQTAHEDSLAILTTRRGYIADTSVANVIVIDSQGRFLSPKREDILVGSTLLTLEKLLAREGIPIQYCDISVDTLRSADEIVLTGSSGGVWFGGSFEGSPFRIPDAGPRARMAMTLWKQYVGMDYVAQASKYATSSVPTSPLQNL